MDLWNVAMYVCMYVLEYSMVYFKIVSVAQTV
jgi:hypothetical protein